MTSHEQEQSSTESVVEHATTPYNTPCHGTVWCTESTCNGIKIASLALHPSPRLSKPPWGWTDAASWGC